MTQPDAYIIMLGEELRAQCAQRDELTTAIDALPPRSPDYDAMLEQVYAGVARYHEILHALRDTPATTLEGMRVKAWSVLHWLSPEGEVPDDNDDARVAWSLAMDVLGKRRQSSPT